MGDELVLAGENLYVVVNSYLNPGDSDYWYYYCIMTPSEFYTNFFVWSEFDSLGSSELDGFLAVRSVINVSVDTGFTSGDGTLENPYVIE